MNSLERFIPDRDWISIVMLFIGVVLIFARMIDTSRFKSLWRLPFDSSYFSAYESNVIRPFNAFNLSLLTVITLEISFFIYLWARHYGWVSIENPVPYFQIIGLTLLYFLLKHLLEKSIAWITGISSFQQEMARVKGAFLINIHLYLLLFLIPAFYYFEGNTGYLKFISVLYFILLLVRYIYFILRLKNQTIPYLFYFILYLCTLEISPLLFLMKWGITKESL